jgi:hypothetical protein
MSRKYIIKATQETTLEIYFPEKQMADDAGVVNECRLYEVQLFYNKNRHIKAESPNDL